MGSQWLSHDCCHVYNGQYCGEIRVRGTQWNRAGVCFLALQVSHLASSMTVIHSFFLSMLHWEELLHLCMEKTHFPLCLTNLPISYPVDFAVRNVAFYCWGGQHENNI